MAQYGLDLVKVAQIKSEARLSAASQAASRAKGVPTRELIVFLKPGEDIASVARDYGLSVRRALSKSEGVYLLAADSVQNAQRRRNLIKLDKRTRDVFVNEYVQKKKFAFVPNDPYFAFNSPNGFPGQWHLYYQANPTVDVHVRGAWNRDITGQGVTIGIVDDCLERTHPDLVQNYVAGLSYDFGSADMDPSPALASDMHGTSVAGVAAARGGNGIGITGAAPYASLAGLRVLFTAGATTAMFVEATMHQSTDAAPNIQIKNHSYGYSYPFVETPAEIMALEKSSSASTIHVFAAGNERGDVNEDSARQHILNHPDTLSVAAMGSNGKFASYSSYGASVFVTAPSSSFSPVGLFGITTTDRLAEQGYNGPGTGDVGGDPFPNLDYNSIFGGTSSAAPLVSGILALGRQVNPRMNIRLAKHLLARTSDIVDATDATLSSDGGWITNGAGFHFNQNYGFGRIDADEFTQIAANYAVTPVQTETVAPVTVDEAIPDASATGVTQTFDVNSTTPLEEVMIHLNITHSFQGDVLVYLTSPMGTRSRLMAPSPGDPLPNIDWTFLSNAFWGENPQGTWTLQVYDVYTADTGRLNSFSAELRMGTIVENRAVRGNVTQNGVGVEGVTVTAVGPTTVTTTTGLNGSYWLVAPVPGTYTVSAAKAGYTFLPSSQVVTLSVGGVTADFAAGIATYISRDFALSGDGSLRVLQVSSDDARIAKVTGSTAQLGMAYPIQAGWTPVAIAAGADGKASLLWNGPDGALSLMTFNDAGTRESSVPLGAFPGVIAKDIAIAGDGSVRILQVSATQARILKVSGSGVQGGPAVSIPSGWTPVAVASGSDNKTQLLWSGPGGAASVMAFNASGGRESYQALGTYPGVASKDIAVAGDGSIRILQVSATLVRILKVMGSTLQYGQARSIPSGWTPMAISSGLDDRTHLLWGSGGMLGVMTMNASGVREAYVSMGPY